MIDLDEPVGVGLFTFVLLVKNKKTPPRHKSYALMPEFSYSGAFSRHSYSDRIYYSSV